MEFKIISIVDRKTGEPHPYKRDQYRIGRTVEIKPADLVIGQKLLLPYIKDQDGSYMSSYNGLVTTPLLSWEFYCYEGVLEFNTRNSHYRLEKVDEV